jgi:hypothetical protein
MDRSQLFSGALSLKPSPGLSAGAVESAQMKSTREFESMARRYLHLLRNTLMNTHYRPDPRSEFSETELQLARQAIERVQLKFGQLAEQNGIPQSKEIQIVLNSATPQMVCTTIDGNRSQGHTLLEASSLDNVESCARQLIGRKIPGDFMECGVFRGGTAIYMRGILEALGEKQRRVWLADSFEGLPEPDPLVSPLDAIFHEYIKLIGCFKVSQDAVRDNFMLYGLLDQQVVFLPGWFRDTLPTAPIEQLALLRIDADYYESTVDVLETLYPKVSLGGMIIIDDYGMLPLGARRAVNEYRAAHDIKSPLLAVNGRVVYWEKTE